GVRGRGGRGEGGVGGGRLGGWGHCAARGQFAADVGPDDAPVPRGGELRATPLVEMHGLQPERAAQVLEQARRKALGEALARARVVAAGECPLDLSVERLGFDHGSGSGRANLPAPGAAGKWPVPDARPERSAAVTAGERGTASRGAALARRGTMPPRAGSPALAATAGRGERSSRATR